MRRSPALLLVVLAALLVAAAPAHAIQVGIDADATLLAGGKQADEAIAAWKRLGVDAVRIQIQWARVAPDPDATAPPLGFNPSDPGDPLYHWQGIDDAVGRVVAAGLKPILMIDGPPPLWGSGNPLLGNPRYKPSAPAFGRFAGAVAARYGAVVDQYILWNEPNLPLWIQPQATCGARHCTPASPDTYRAMVRAAYDPIHTADPVATVLIGALAPAGGDLKSRNANMRPLEFLRALACVNAKLRVLRTGGCRNFQPALADGFAYHPHGTKNPPDQDYANPDDATLASLPRVERLLDRLQGSGRIWSPNKPMGLWLDEYGYQTRPPDKLRGVTPGRQDLYLQQASYLAARDPRVQMLSQYLWQDEPVGPPPRYTGWQSGLLFADGTPKPALAHFADPFWVDYRAGTLWGQVRPGGAHAVVVERRMPGAATSWAPIGNVQTADDGTWTLRTALVPFASYRSVSDDGEVSAAMVAAPPVSAGNGGGGPSGSVDGLLVDRRAVSTRPGAAVPPSFAGMSIEYWSLADYIFWRGAVNPIFARLVGQLAAGGHGAPTLRVGGNSTDETWWSPDGTPGPAAAPIVLTPAWLGRLRAWEARMRTPLLLGLDLGASDPANAAAFAQAAASALPAGSLQDFEIGNEPDLYSQPTVFQVSERQLVRTQKRPADYGYAQYRDEVDRYMGALAAAVPGVPLSAGGFATSVWEDQEGDLLANAGGRLPGFNTHVYALDTCGSAARKLGSSYYTSALLGTSAYRTPVQRAQLLAGIAAANGAVLRVSEANTATCGGVHGGSDTFASALWGLDVLFGLADAGVRNVDFHTWNGAWYAPITWSVRGGHLTARVRPLFYAMLLFDRATPAGARLVPVAGNAATVRLKTWATVDRRGTRRIVIVNKDPSAGHKLVLRVPGGAATGQVVRLLAPSIAATSGVTYGGQSYGMSTRDGLLRGRPVSQKVVRKLGAFRVVMPPGSAALLTVRSAR